MISTKKIMLVLWDILLFSMLAFPRIMQIPKLAILAFLIANILFNKIKICMEKHYAMFILCWFIYHILTSVVGIMYGNDINLILANARFNILLFGVLFIITNAVAQQDGCLKHTLITCVLTTLYIGVYNIAITVLIYTNRTISFLRYLDATANVGIHIGYSHIVTTNMSMLILLFPFCLLLLSCGDADYSPNKKWIKMAIWISGVAMILSGRRIIWLILAIALIVYFLKTSSSPKKTARNIAIGIVLLVGAYMALRNSRFFSLDSLRTRFVSVFIRDTSAGGESIRFDQVSELTNRFLERPILGAGAGAKTSYSRGGVWVTSSSFEMSYSAVLFNGGIFGALLYVGSLLGLGKHIKSLKVRDKNLSFVCMIAFLMCTLANATNPYFSSSFDFLIMLFLPLVVVQSAVCAYDKG